MCTILILVYSFFRILIPFFTYELLKWNDTFFGVAYDRISKTQKYSLLNQSLVSYK